MRDRGQAGKTWGPPKPSHFPLGTTTTTPERVGGGTCERGGKERAGAGALGVREKGQDPGCEAEGRIRTLSSASGLRQRVVSRDHFTRLHPLPYGLLTARQDLKGPHVLAQELSPFAIGLPTDAPLSASKDSLSAWAPATQGGVPSFWLPPGPTLAVQNIWGVNERMAHLTFCLFLSVTLPFKKQNRKQITRGWDLGTVVKAACHMSADWYSGCFPFASAPCQ